MSFSKTDQVFTGLTQEEIAKLIAEMLRGQYGKSGSARKIIGRKIGVDPRTVRNWYEGNSAPNLAHFITLARRSPVFVEWFLRHSGHDDLAETFLARSKAAENGSSVPSLEFYSIKIDPINMEEHLEVIQNLNQRQVWFYFQIQQGHLVTARDLVEVWQVGLATAKRDIAGLVNLGLVCYVGSKRAGFYVTACKRLKV